MIFNLLELDVNTLDPDTLDKDPRVSFWLKRAWRIAQTRDPLDATRDAAALLQLCRARENRIFREAWDDR